MIVDLAARKAPLIAINGGDGTVSDVMTMVSRLYPADGLPHLAIFPSGNTNLIAQDIGFSRRGLEAIRMLRDQQDALERIVRRPLQVSWPDGSRRPRLGMFHGSTGYARAIAIAHSPHVLRYAPHDFAVGVTLLGAFGSLLRRRQREIWLSGDPARIETPDGVVADGQSFLFIASALRQLNRGIWPFWNDDPAVVEGLHYLNVSAYPERLLAATIALLRGRAPEWLRQSRSYTSGSVSEIKLTSDSDFVLDGERSSPGPGGAIVLSRGPAFTFLHDRRLA